MKAEQAELLDLSFECEESSTVQNSNEFTFIDGSATSQKPAADEEIMDHDYFADPLLACKTQRQTIETVPIQNPSIVVEDLSVTPPQVSPNTCMRDNTSMLVQSSDTSVSSAASSQDD